MQPLFLARYGLKALAHAAFDPVKALRGSVQAGGCVVMGNGPSLATDLQVQGDAISRCAKVCVNNFARSEWFEKLRPEYYVLADTNYFSPKVQRIMADIAAGRTEAYPARAIDYYSYVREINESTFTSLIDKTAWPLALFLPLQGLLNADLSWIPKKNPNIRIVPYSMTPVSNGPDWLRHALYERSLAMPRAETVLVPAIFLALHLGHKPIYVLGADHSWHENIIVGADNVLSIRDPHFYDGESEPRTFPCVKDHVTGQTYRLSEQWRSLANAFESHEALDAYARSQGARVYNACARSFLDMYERAKVGERG
ncbi:MAG: hypothetical protein QM778_37140 [Myxococcales bacterium]